MIKTTLHDRPEGGFIAEYSADVQPNLDHNAALRNDGTKGWSKSRNFKRVASIPNILIHKWLVEDGFSIYSGKSCVPQMAEEDHKKALLRRVNDHNYCKLRTDK